MCFMFTIIMSVAGFLTDLSFANLVRIVKFLKFLKQSTNLLEVLVV